MLSPAARAGRDPHRRGDRPCHRVVAQRCLPRLQVECRHPTPSCSAQFDDAERALRALGIPAWPMVEDEADDAIAPALARFGDDPRVEQVVDLQRRQGPRPVRLAATGWCCATGCGRSPTTRRASSRNSAWSRRASPTTSRWSATPATASPACRAGARRARPRCWRRWKHLEPIPPRRWTGTCRSATRPPRGDARAAARRARSSIAPGHPQQRRGHLPATSTAWRGTACRGTTFLALCEELGFEPIRQRVHRWA